MRVGLSAITLSCQPVTVTLRDAVTTSLRDTGTTSFPPLRDAGTTSSPPPPAPQVDNDTSQVTNAYLCDLGFATVMEGDHVPGRFGTERCVATLCVCVCVHGSYMHALCIHACMCVCALFSHAYMLTRTSVCVCDCACM